MDSSALLLERGHLRVGGMLEPSGGWALEGLDHCFRELFNAVDALGDGDGMMSRNEFRGGGTLRAALARKAAIPSVSSNSIVRPAPRPVRVRSASAAVFSWAIPYRSDTVRWACDAAGALSTPHADPGRSSSTHAQERSRQLVESLETGMTPNDIVAVFDAQWGN
eukprot:gene5067-biopygen17614